MSVYVNEKSLARSLKIELNFLHKYGHTYISITYSQIKENHQKCTEPHFFLTTSLRIPLKRGKMLNFLFSIFLFEYRIDARKSSIHRISVAGLCFLVVVLP